MNLYNDASIIITPNGFKAGKLYAVKGADLTVTRATSATRVNANGVIETVGANVPLIDHTGGGCPTILVQPQRTNSLLNSATVANQTIITGAVAYTLSFYGSGTITLSGTHTATVVGLGTARKTYTFTPTAGNLVLTVSGTCTNGQLEAGSYATSYIPTTSAIVTRNADVISKTGISSLIGQTEGTMFVDFYVDNLASQTNNPVILSLGADQYIGISYNGRIQFYFESGCNIDLTSFALTNGRHKFGFGYKANDFVAYVDGTLAGTDTSGTPNGTSLLNLGYSNTNFIGKINYNTVALWKTRLTNTQLAELTTI
jgi:hypothetical protein